ncbi:hypothetical protein [Streptomyces sp. NPDC001652]|uniref:hypothetical protein n=1 Tax=Streptomyces sp. NPDC001652 TaxID=3154393 RepID=UPI00332EC96B
MKSNPTDGPVHEYFELSYADHLVKNRTLLQSMPTEWQEQFVTLLRQLDDAFDHVDKPKGYRVTAGRWMQLDDMTLGELDAAGIRMDGEEPGAGPGDDTRYHREEDGAELEGHDYAFVPGPNPIRHYRHAYIEPRLQSAVIAANKIELEGGDVMLQELSVGDPIEIEKQTGPLTPGIWEITGFECERRCRARVRRMTEDDIRAAREREATARIYE